MGRNVPTGPGWAWAGLGAPAEEIAALILSGDTGPRPPGWAQWENVREAHALAARAYAEALVPPGRPGEGRGLVSAGGGLTYFPSLYAQLRRLREVGCTLPAEVWHFGPAEMGPGMARLLEGLGAVTVDAHAHVAAVPPPGHVGGWQLKPYFVLWSRFAEALWLDADSWPLADPAALFESEGYQACGSYFWPDFAGWALGPHVWAAFGLAAPREVPRGAAHGSWIPGGTDAPFESGQLLIDKRRCWRELALAAFFAGRSDFTFLPHGYVHGDKECFRLAWHWWGTPYALAPRLPGWREHTMIQHGPGGAPLFYHRTMDKLRLEGNRPAGLPEEPAMHRAVEELTTLWCGRPWWNAAPTPAEAAYAARLAGRTFEARGPGERRTLTLQAGGRLEGGSPPAEAYWSAWIDRGEPTLAVLSAAESLTSLYRQVDGGFAGRWPTPRALLRPAGGHSDALAAPYRAQLPEAPDSREAPFDAAKGRPGPSGGPRLAVIVPALIQSEVVLGQACALFDCLAGLDGAKLYLICNGLRNVPLTPAGLRREAAARSGLEVVLEHGPRSVAAAWNRGARLALADGAGLFVWAATDTTPGPACWAALTDYAGRAGPDGVDLWSGSADGGEGGEGGPDFNLFCMAPAAFCAHGWFDENFQPAYYEDNDYHARIALAGRSACRLPAAPFGHVGSGTLRADPLAAHAVSVAGPRNAAYFAKKWGRPPVDSEAAMRSQYYRAPFNDASRPLHWWPGVEHAGA